MKTRGIQINRIDSNKAPTIEEQGSPLPKPYLKAFDQLIVKKPILKKGWKYTEVINTSPDRPEQSRFLLEKNGAGSWRLEKDQAYGKIDTTQIHSFDQMTFFPYISTGIA